jgi:hypothetical protein
MDPGRIRPAGRDINVCLIHSFRVSALALG